MLYLKIKKGFRNCSKPLVLEAGVLQISLRPLSMGFPDIPFRSVPELDTFNLVLTF